MRRNKRLIVAGATALALSMLVLGGGGLRAHGDKDDDDERGFEIWTVDQAGTAGTLYIYDGEDLNENASTAVPEVFDLGATVAPLCLARTGSSPVRGHMMTFSPGDTHAVLAYVATGHVVFLEAATRTPVECIDVGLQAHAAFSSPDGTYVAVANQNGKLLQRIRTNYATNTFVLEAAATLDLATCVTPSGAACQDPARRPDTAPICPVIDSSSRLVFTTLRGGGLFVVDGTATPMRIVAEYDQATVRANGCGGIEQGGRMYVNAGGGTAGNPTENDLYSFRLSAFPFAGSAPPNTPSPRTIYVFDSGSHDGHGALVNRAAHGRYLWVGDRFSNEIMVVDTRTDRLVSIFSLAGDVSPDPAPDLMARSPKGGYAYVSLRGPCPQTGNAPAFNNAVGATPGVGVIKVRAAGRRGELVGVAPISNPSAPFTCTTVGGTPTLTERADPHSLNVRRK
jgi:DNA-binding beta-propeller fold protein YncE